LVLLSGLPGTGKTVLAGRISASLGAVHLESDAVRIELTPDPQFTRSENARVFSRLELRATRHLTAGKQVVLDATNLTEADRSRFLSLAERLDVVVVPVRVSVPDDIVRERLSHPREGFSQAGVDVFERMHSHPEPFSRPGVVVDTRFDLAPAIDLVKTLLHDST